jgi:hypothetical protein
MVAVSGFDHGAFARSKTLQDGNRKRMIRANADS